MDGTVGLFIMTISFGIPFKTDGDGGPLYFSVPFSVPRKGIIQHFLWQITLFTWNVRDCIDKFKKMICITGRGGAMKLMLDPGHGGHDPGAVAHGLREKDLTLDIAQRIRHMLEAEYEGVEVRLTRESDTDVSLSQRARMANQWGADFFLSIHVNAGGGTGWESYRFPSVPARTVTYQDIIHAEVIREVQVTDRGKKTANFVVLRETAMPALLTENLFIDNAQDAARLKDAAFREKLARGHVAGLAKAFGLKRKEAPVVPGPFPDVPSSHWAAEAIQVVKDAGLMTGREDGSFGPNEPVTRAQMAVILAALLKKIYG